MAAPVGPAKHEEEVDDETTRTDQDVVGDDTFEGRALSASGSS